MQKLFTPKDGWKHVPLKKIEKEISKITKTNN